MTDNFENDRPQEDMQISDDSSATDASTYQEPQTPIIESFTQLISNEQLLEAINKLGFSKPTPIQAQAIPFALAGKDIIAQASTGSGKTAAFVLPLISKIYTELGDKIPESAFSLILAPTRELAVQISEVIQTLSDIKPPLLIGGSDMKVQENSLERDSRIVVGTPGRVLDFITQKKLNLKACRFFVLDEADEMLSMGFLQDVRSILSRLPDKRQGMFVSATITPRVDMLANSFLNKPEIVVAIAAAQDKQNIEHFFIEVKNDILAKPAALSDIIETWRPRSAIIFCNTKSDTELVEVLLRKRGFDARRINSDLSQPQRNRIMKKIRSEELQFLVATDIAARGLDIEHIELVVNYSIHEQPETYVHRTGRTGRAGRFGKAISLVGAQDFGYFHHMTKVLSTIKFEKISMPTDADVIDARLAHLYEILRKENIALKERDNLLAQTLLKELGHIENAPEALVETTAKLCRAVFAHRLNETTTSLDEEISTEKAEDGEQPSKRHSDKKGGENRRGDKRGRDEGRGKKRDFDKKDGNRTDGNREARSDNRRDDNRREKPKDAEGNTAREGKSDATSDKPRNEPRRDNDRNNRRDNPRGDKDGNRRDTRSNDGERRDRNRNDSDRRGSNRPRQERLPADQEFRIYIGQGTSHGMTEDTFVALAADMGEVKKESLKNLSIRGHYGYVDIKGADAQKLIANLNGIEYNGEVLPVKLATELSQGERRNQE